MSTRALTLALVLACAPFTAFGGPGEGGGPRPGGHVVSETLPELPPLEQSDDMTHPQDERNNERRDEILEH